jgi:peptide deformylase
MPIDTETLSLVHYPAPILQERSKAVAEVNDEVRAVARRLIELMHEHEGVGLAAPQAGVPWRIFVTRGDEDEPDLVYINPELTLARTALEPFEEGCLSLPGIHVTVRRPTTATIVALDIDGNPFTVTSDDFIARIWQHEFDHLNGTLIINRMSPIDRLSTRKALKELKLAAGS